MKCSMLTMSGSVAGISMLVPATYIHTYIHGGANNLKFAPLLCLSCFTLG